MFSERNQVNVKFISRFALFRMDEFLAQVPDIYKDIYRRHWRTIRTSVKRGILKDVYHFPINNYTGAEDYLAVVRRGNAGRIKMNACFGFILRHRESNELRFFHPSNNTLLFEVPVLLINEGDYANVLERIDRQDALEYARLQRPSTIWTVERIVCVRFDVYRNW